MQIIFFWLGNQSFLFRSFHWSQNISTLFFIFLINVFLLLFEQVAPPHFVHGRVWLPNPKCVYRSSRISLSFFCLTNSWFSCSRSPSCSTSLTEAKEDEDDDDVAIALFSQNCTRAYSLHVWMSNLAISLHLHTHTHTLLHTLEHSRKNAKRPSDGEDCGDAIWWGRGGGKGGRKIFPLNEAHENRTFCKTQGPFGRRTMPSCSRSGDGSGCVMFPHTKWCYLWHYISHVDEKDKSQREGTFFLLFFSTSIEAICTLRNMDKSKKKTNNLQIS